MMKLWHRQLYHKICGGRPCRVYKVALVCLPFMLAVSCAAVGPDYTPIKPNASATWHSTLDGGLTADRAAPDALARWWAVLDDPELTSLIDRAVQGNLSLKDAQARLHEARALRGISKAGLFPALDAKGSATKRRSIDSSGTGGESELYAAGFDAGWELDIFGGLRRSVEAAQAALEASQADLHDVLVSLQAEVALNYVDVRTYQARLAVAKANIRAQRDTVELIMSRYQAGLMDDLAVQQSRYNLESTRSEIPSLQAGLSAAKNRLAVLLGKTPGALHQELARPIPVPVPPITVAVGVPADALRHRPDIRQAERLLAAQTARIGMATADLYPKFRLAGTIGLESVKSEDLFEWASRIWAIGPSVSWHIFDAGAIRRNIEAQTARQEQALIHYQATVLGALEEVENALVSYAKEQRKRQSLALATAAAKQADIVARDRYRAGLVDYGNVLDAERSLLLFQDKLAQSEGAVTSNLVRLYKALGGGWEPVPPGKPGKKRDTKVEVGNSEEG